ncbi:Tfp pilus assembly protein FimT/FimU [Brevundimonas sp. PAMC22021]|uniref:pilus assembly FimT family protein n=1 Tax=Brevundimonas sp. PAMC22021 TaxID=2861285 RepID=UPI001C63172C|nr:prepilin-type N-terminal cleavage/methylation domain-containing protein [Brevundimonas sp. PAMC22021]QYF86438.1 prepilin-type N-terminal cleavage/methylation domain-containing protein [Brevundimonas sp. PAMC22021]
MPTSPPTNARIARRGFSLIEILVVLAIFAMSAAVIMPSTSRMLDQASSHAVFFEFQKQISDFRREANRTGVALRVADPEAALATNRVGAGSLEPETDASRTVTLRSPWRYTLAPALDIEAGGACSAATANLINGDRVVMTLRTAEGDCRFIRLQTGAAPPRASSSQ